MKIRNDFVTNSSSSSFVVAFNKEPQNIDDVKKELFGDTEFYFHPYDDTKYEAEYVSNTVYNDIKEQSPATLSEITEAIECGWYNGRPEYDDYRLKDGGFDWEAYERDSKKKAEDIAKEFIKQNPNKTIYTFSYADEDGSYYGALEHGDLFDKLPYLKISCH